MFIGEGGVELTSPGVEEPPPTTPTTDPTEPSFKPFEFSNPDKPEFIKQPVEIEGAPHITEYFTCNQEFNVVQLEKTNELRRLHGVPELEFDGTV